MPGKTNAAKKKLEWYEDISGKGKKLRKVTLMYLIKEREKKVLLAMKKRGFGAGRLNGVGGKQEKQESIEETACREAKEEIGITPLKYEKAGAIRFYFDGPQSDEFNQEVTVFVAKKWRGEPKESEEMKPKWFKMDRLPYDKMWQDDKYWLEKVLNGKKIDAAFLFGGKDYKEIIDLRMSFLDK
ncbi:MAG: 8-oxo-dGTP diphosphatase [Candidatus Micrarchaeia archaeon]